MIRNYLNIALRSMLRNKAYSTINIFGLSVGVACCLLLTLYIQDELSYDRHHNDGERIYRITTVMDLYTDGRPGPRTSPPIAWGIKNEVPEFQTVARIFAPPGVAQSLIRNEHHLFYESGGYVADSTMFDVLTYEFIEGNPKKALTNANSVVVTETLAKKLFANEPALNKIINIDQDGLPADFKITGVVRNDHNSHIKANFFIAINSSGWAEYARRSDVADEWAGQNFMMSYVKLTPGYSLPDVIAKMNGVFIKHGADDLKALGMSKTLGLESLQDIYLSSITDQSPRIVYLYVVASIAFFILFIACINFMNLSTAKAAKRAGEVGLRKTLGAYRSSLIFQFLGEALVIVVVAIIISCMIVQLALPGFNEVTGKNVRIETNNILFISLSLAGITLITGLIAGCYPAFYLSSFNPASVLKSKSVLQSTNSLLRRSLVVFQFVIAITLVSGMIVITRQLRFMQEQSLGFNPVHKIVLPLRTQMAQNNYTALRNEVSKIPSVNGVTATNYIPGSPILTDFSLYPQGSNMEKSVMIKNNWVEPDYLGFLGIKLIAGENFSENRSSDSWNKLIVNMEAVEQFGFTAEEIVGEPLYFDYQGERYEFRVIGVMEDYHQISLKEKIQPLALRVNETPNHNFMIVDTDGQNLSKTLAAFEDTWKKINSDTPFEFTFLDETIQKQYDEDQRASVVISMFTIIAMIISCLGLYGLSTYMAERRFKEIGVRKVMGATAIQIMRMMSSEFLKLVLVAFVISVPLAWYAIDFWLGNFAYKAPVNAMVFIAAGVSALAIALVTVSFESVKAASENPAKALRNE